MQLIPIKLCLISFLWIVNGQNETAIREEFFKNLSKQRYNQMMTIKSFDKIKEHEKRFELILQVTEKIFPLLQDSRAIIEASGYIPGLSDVPSDQTVRDAFVSLIDNTILFGEMVLHYPDFITPVLKSNNPWDVIYKWAAGFCQQVEYLLDDRCVGVLELVNQELHYVEPNPFYRNPYTVSEEAPTTVKPPKKSTKTKKTTTVKPKKGMKLKVAHMEL